MMSRTDLLLKLVSFDATQAHSLGALHILEEETMRHVGPERLMEARRTACIEALKEKGNAEKRSDMET